MSASPEYPSNQAMTSDPSAAAARPAASAPSANPGRPAPRPRRWRPPADARPGILLIVASVIALALANSPLADGFHALLQTPVGPALAADGPLTVHAWIADGLLVVFFFVTGVELRAEFTTGSLSSPRRAVVPIAAALGGMAAPAGIYLLVNLLAGQAGQPHGWAVPTATDIAFAVSLLALVAPGVSAGARAFLLALAVADDLFAIIVIAVFYTGGGSLAWLAGAAAAIAAFWAVATAGRRVALRGVPDGPRFPHRRAALWALTISGLGLAAIAWWCTLRSGVHPTIAGVALGLAIAPDASARVLATLEPVSTWAAVPLFAFVSAGVPVGLDALADAAGDPVSIGVLAGLVLGKPLGILVVTWLVTRLTGRASARDAGGVPDGASTPGGSSEAGASWPDLWVVAILAGVGFTVSLLVASLAFDSAEHVANATVAVLAASVVAPLLASVAWRLIRRRRAASR